jgi:hypothetical protein
LKRGKNKKSRRRRGLTLARIIVDKNKNFRGKCPKRKTKGKNRTRIVVRSPPLFFPS